MTTAPRSTPIKWAPNTPVWLLDVDGVINCSNPNWHQKPSTGKAYAFGMKWPMRWAPSLIVALHNIHSRRLAEIRWCTTWCEGDSVRDLEALWELPEFQSAIPSAERNAVNDTVKFDAALRVITCERRPLIWTDDKAIPTHGVQHDDLTRSGRNLLIRPNESRGLVPEHIIQIITFCEAALAER